MMTRQKIYNEYKKISLTEMVSDIFFQFTAKEDFTLRQRNLR